MKIDPCPCVISLKDGSVHTLFEFRHFLELVEDCMGYDAANMGNHDVETGRAVFDRWAGDCRAPVMKAIWKATAEPFRIFKRKPPQLPKFFKGSGLIVKKSPIP